MKSTLKNENTPGGRAFKVTITETYQRTVTIYESEMKTTKTEDTTMTKNEDRINKLFKELVPDTGKADSLAGELVRAMSRIGYRFYNDGDQLGIGYGKETCNPAGRFLGAKGNDKIAKLTADAWAVYSEEAYEKVLDILCGAVADYVEQNPDLRNQPTEDMWDFKDEEEDQDDSWDEEEDDWGEEEDYEDEEDY